MILGSLAIFHAPLELVKEFKEGVELVIDTERNAPKGAGSILNLR